MSTNRSKISPAVKGAAQRARPTAPLKSVSAKPTGNGYVMRISRMTIDKLGVRLYDTVSAVVAELVANGYDADADKVTIRLPLATQLAKRASSRVGGKPVITWEDQGSVIEVIDDGHGMTRKKPNGIFWLWDENASRWR